MLSFWKYFFPPGIIIKYPKKNEVKISICTAMPREVLVLSFTSFSESMECVLAGVSLVNKQPRLICH